MTRSPRLALRRTSVPRCSGALLACALAAACGGGTEPTPPDNTITLSAEHVWAGSWVEVSSPVIARSATRPEILLDTLVVPTMVFDGTTLALTVPGTGGDFRVSLRFQDTTLTGPTLHVAGFTGLRHAGFMSWNTWISPVSEPRVPEVIFASDTVIRILNATDLSFRDYPQFKISETRIGDGYYAMSLGTSWIPGGYTLADSNGWGVFRLDGPATLVQATNCTTGKYGCISLSPTVRLDLESHDDNLYRGPTEPGYHIWDGWPGPGVFSPRGDRMMNQSLGSVLDLGATVGDGNPVFAVPSGMLAYTVPLVCPGSVAFSRDGALLAVGTCRWISSFMTTQDPPAVRLFDAANGIPAGTIPLHNWPLAIAFDPAAPRLYVAVTDSLTDSVTVQVYDPATRVLEAQLGTPLTVNDDDGYAPTRTALVFSGEPALYLVTMGLSGGQVTSARFSLLP